MSPWTGEAAGLAARISAYLQGSLAGTPPEPWEALALDVHRWQHARDPVVASYGPPAARWEDLPAVPVGVFKDLPVGTVRPDEPHRVFRTSGTTGGGRGEHRLRSAALYDLGASGWASACLGGLWPDDALIVGLLEDPLLTPDSSLSHMVGAFPGRKVWCVRDGVLDHAGARAAIAEGPAFLASTAFAAAELLAAGGAPSAPPGGIAMITGGFKGRVHQLDEAGILDALRGAGWRVVSEYGMTELSSQLWRTDTLYLPPPWLRVRAVDPLSGRLLGPGERGQLRFWDLANLDGTLGIETMDEGIVDDEGRLLLFGRMSGAPPRGCSLTVEEAWARRS